MLLRQVRVRLERANFTVIMLETYLQHDMSRSMILTVAWTPRGRPTPMAFQNPSLDPSAAVRMDRRSSLG